MMRFDIDLGDTALQAYLEKLQVSAENLAPAMEAIATLGEAEIEERFQSETAPDGTRWEDSQRKRESGGKTLTQTGRLRRSASSEGNNESATWGVNAIYAAIHQFGGKITAKGGGALKFRLPNGNYIQVKSVTIPARPYLPKSLDELNQDAIVEILTDHLKS